MAETGTYGPLLVVEDHEPSAKIISTVFAEVAPSISVRLVSSGDECLSELRDDSTSDPHMILLDLGLPDTNGLRILEIRNNDPNLQEIPTIVLSGQDDPETITASYAAGANSFIRKPTDFDGYLEMAETVVDYWYTTAALPDPTAEEYKDATHP